MTSHSELRQWAGDSLRGIINVALRPPGRVPVSWGIGNGCFTAQDTIFSGKVLWSGAGRQLLNRTCFLLNRESWRRNYQRMFSFDNLFAAVWEPEHWHIVIEKCVSTAIQRLQPPGEKSNLKDKTGAAEHANCLNRALQSRVSVKTYEDQSNMAQTSHACPVNMPYINTSNNLLFQF